MNHSRFDIEHLWLKSHFPFISTWVYRRVINRMGREGKYKLYFLNCTLMDSFIESESSFLMHGWHHIFKLVCFIYWIFLLLLYMLNIINMHLLWINSIFYMIAWTNDGRYCRFANLIQMKWSSCKYVRDCRCLSNN